MIPLRLLYFAVVYWDRQWHTWKRQGSSGPLRLSPVLPLVLYTGATPWGSNRKLVQLFGEPKVFHEFVPDWEPLFWNVAEQSAESLLESGEPWLQLLAVVRSQKAEAAEFLRVFGEVFGRVQDLHGNEQARWYDLLRAVYAWGMWRRAPQEQTALLAVAEASQTELVRRQEVRVMGQTIAEALLEEGRSKGKAEGRAEGKAEGVLLATRANLRRLLEKRFGPLPSLLIQRLEATTDIDRLQAAFDQAVDLGKLDDLKL
jgi:hypothetical protein